MHQKQPPASVAFSSTPRRYELEGAVRAVHRTRGETGDDAEYERDEDEPDIGHDIGAEHWRASSLLQGYAEHGPLRPCNSEP